MGIFDSLFKSEPKDSNWPGEQLEVLDQLDAISTASLTAPSDQTQNGKKGEPYYRFKKNFHQKIPPVQVRLSCQNTRTFMAARQTAP